jgi:hypothetical protein
LAQVSKGTVNADAGRHLDGLGEVEIPIPVAITITIPVAIAIAIAISIAISISISVTIPVAVSFHVGSIALVPVSAADGSDTEHTHG